MGVVQALIVDNWVNSGFGFDEGPVLKVLKGLAQFLLGVHDDGPIPGNRLIKRL